MKKHLSGGIHLTREELIAELNEANIATDQNRASHLFARAELEKIICSGSSRNGKSTYALLSDRVPKTRELVKEEALAKLASRYFASRCPATLQDFTKWSGLSAGDARQALELVTPNFDHETIDRHTYWIARDVTILPSNQPSTLLLPPYDEFLIGYSDRRASISAEFENHLKEISDRGVFRPVILVNGQVVGIWNRTINKDFLILKLEFFSQPDQKIILSIEEAAVLLGDFWGKKIKME